MAKYSSPFSFLWQALLLPSKNAKLIFTVFLIFIVSQALIYVGFELSIVPLISKIHEYAKLLPTIDRSSPEFAKLVITIMTAIKQLVIAEAVYYVFVFVISGFLSIIIYCTNSATYVGEMITLRELMNKVKGNIIGPLITTLFIALFCFTYLVILFAIVFVTHDSVISTPSILLATFCIFYLMIIWAMGMAISVIEPSFYGIDAISQAAKLLKAKKMQVSILTVALSVACILMNGFNVFGKMFSSDAKAGTLLLGFVKQVVVFYVMMAVTVLYYECKSDQSVGILGEGVQYSNLVTSIV